MTLFIIVAALLLGAALLFIVPPLIRREPADAAVERRTLNISVYRDQLAEMERDLQNDVLTPEQYRQGREELERRLLEDVAETPGSAAPSPPRAARASAIVAIVLVPLLAAGGYLLLGAPGILLSPQAAPTAYGLSSGVVTKSLPAAFKAIRTLRCGTVNINDVPGFRIESSPFGGIKDSGLGVKEGVIDAIKAYSYVKTFSLPW